MDAVVATTNLELRTATVADIAAVVALVESAYRGDVSRRGWTTEADILDGQRVDTTGVSQVVVQPDSRVVLGLRGSELVACFHVERHDSTCYFGMFAVNPDLQGVGFGRRMLDEAERIARTEWNCTKMEMTVICLRDELVAWYARRGYRRTGRFKPFPYGDARFGLPKRDDLRFEYLEKML